MLTLILTTALASAALLCALKARKAEAQSEGGDAPPLASDHHGLVAPLPRALRHALRAGALGVLIKLCDLCENFASFAVK